jgi:hypothetical protein
MNRAFPANMEKYLNMEHPVVERQEGQALHGMGWRYGDVFMHICLADSRVWKEVLLSGDGGLNRLSCQQVHNPSGGGFSYLQLPLADNRTVERRCVRVWIHARVRKQASSNRAAQAPGCLCLLSRLRNMPERNLSPPYHISTPGAARQIPRILKRL